VRQALDGAPLTVRADGRQTRAFTDVSDAVAATIALSQSMAALGEIFNVAASEEIMIIELARRIIRLAASGSSITHVPYEKAYGPGFEDVRRRVISLR